MNRQALIGILMVLVVAGGGFGVYKFYYEPTLEKYQQDEAFYNQLLDKYNHFNDVFSGTEPQVVLDEWRQRVQPWQNAVDDRKSFFQVGDAMDVDPVPEEVLAKFYYEEKFGQAMNAMLEDVYRRGIMVDYQQTWGAPRPGELTNRSVSNEEVVEWLRTIKYGQSIVRGLMDAGANPIYEVNLWPQRTELGILRMRTTGLRFQMTMANLVKFVNERTSDIQQYTSVDAIQVTNSNLVGSTDPLLNVAMIITEATYIEGARAQVRGARPAAAPGPGFQDPFMMDFGFGPGGPGGGPGGPPRMVQRKESWWKKLWPF
ncbi:hypothetical protein JXD38_04760 [candidate division WOR-3 bacterium]|nr:hypothetical protein [candidate division WOR-3 bacterium]